MTYILTMNGPGDFMVSEVDDLNIALTEVVVPTGQQADFATPVLDYAGTLVGWGREGWGELAWGDSTNKVVNLVGLQAEVSLGTVTEVVSTVIDGQEATTNVGSVSFVISPTQTLDGQASNTNLGTLGLEFGPASISGVSSTTSVGTLGLEFGPADITGVSATASTGDVVIDDTQIVNVTGVAATSATGSLTPDDLSIGISGFQANISVGNVAQIDDIIEGLVTPQITSTPGVIGVQAYGNIDTGSNTSYSNISTGSNDTYSDVAAGSNSSYSDVSTGSNDTYSDVATGSNTSYSDVA